MSDIVERLRKTAEFIGQAAGKENSHWVTEAADEIDRLRAENRKLRADVSRASYHCD